MGSGTLQIFGGNLAEWQCRSSWAFLVEVVSKAHARRTKRGNVVRLTQTPLKGASQAVVRRALSYEIERDHCVDISREEFRLLIESFDWGLKGFKLDSDVPGGGGGKVFALLFA